MQGDDEDNDDSDEEGGRRGGRPPPPEFEEDGNTDLCVLCGLGGSLLCCDGCPAAYHMRCIGETAKSIPQGEWLCPECSVGGRGGVSGYPWLHPMLVSIAHAYCVLRFVHTNPVRMLGAGIWFLVCIDASVC